jgi:hypothetical protein
MYSIRIATCLSADKQNLITKHIDKHAFYYDADTVNNCLNKHSVVISEEIAKFERTCAKMNLEYNSITVFSDVFNDHIVVNDFFVEFAEEL